MTANDPDHPVKLENVPIFSGLPPEDIRAISSCAVIRTFQKGAILISEGDRTDSLYVILSGRVKVYVGDDKGREVILNMLEPGDYFGELALLDDAPRSASVITLEPCRMSIISKPDFERCLWDNPAIALNLLRALAQRIRALTENVRNLALLDVYGRVARTLLDLAQEREGALVIDQKLTQQDLADMVGASREMVSRILKDLTTGGYITVKDKKITINEKLPSRW
jgi:CRP/FNR family transcriptional regulator, cyclic AMP receptor protein